MTKDDLIAFEKKVAEHWLAGDIDSIFHQSGGNEQQLLDIFRGIRPDDYVFSTHRNHYHALLKGVRASALMKRILAGKSMFAFFSQQHFLSSSLLGGCCAMAAGVALAFHLRGDPRKVHCFVGDGAADNGHLYEAVRFVESKRLPCVFYVEDNDRSSDYDRQQRGADAWVFGQCKCLRWYGYTPTQPHCQAPTGGRKIEFKSQRNEG